MLGDSDALARVAEGGDEVLHPCDSGNVREIVTFWFLRGSRYRCHVNHG